MVSPTALEDLSSGQHVLHEVYQVLKQCKHPPPIGGYPFLKNDHVMMKMGKLPPSPCKCCGSKNHWDKECPDYDTCLEKTKCTANVAEVWPEDESEKTYATAYSILLNERLAGDIVNQPLLEGTLAQQDFRLALSFSQVTEEELSKSREGILVKTARTTIEEVEDEDWLTYQTKLKSENFVMEEVVLTKETFISQMNNEEEGVEPKFRSPSTHEEAETSPKFSELPGPPIPDIRVKLKKKCFAPVGHLQ